MTYPKDQSASESDKYWPAILDATLIAGACEVGKDLFLTGLFGGFGGYLSPFAHRDEAEAIEYLKASGLDGSVFRLKLENLRVYVSKDGQVIKEEP